MRCYFRQTGKWLLASLLAVQPLVAQQWIPDRTGTWSTSSNWVGSAVPISSSTTAITFQPVQSGYTATNDLGNFTLRALTLSNDTNSVLNVVNAVGSSINFNGTQSTLFVGGPGPTMLSGGTVTFISPTSIRDSNLSRAPGTLTITSALAGSGIITLDRQSSGFLGETILNPTSNTHTGTVSINAGALRLGSGTALGTSPISVNTTGSGFTATGDLRAASTMTVSNDITVLSGKTLNILTGSALTLEGDISGPGMLVLGDGFTPGTPSLTLASRSFRQGSTLVNSGTLNLTGTLQSSPLTIGRVGSVVAGNTTDVNLLNHLGDSLTLQGGSLTLVGNTPVGLHYDESIATVNAQSFSTLTIDAQTTTATRLTVNDLIRQNRGTLRLRGDALGSVAFGTAGSATLVVTNINGNPLQNSLVGGGGSVGATTRSILPFAVGSSTVTGAGDGFVTVDVNGLRALNTTTEYDAQLPLANYMNPATTNYRVTLPTVARTIPTTVNGIVFSGGNASIYGVNGAAAPLTVTSGAVLSTGDVQTGPLQFGSAEGMATAANGTMVLGPVTGTNGLTLSGNGEVVITNGTGLSGLITVNSGTLVLASPTSIPSRLINLNGGSLGFRGFSDTLSNPISIGEAGGTLHSRSIGGSTTGNSTVLTLAGPIQGSGPATIGTGGRVVLAGDNSAFTGMWIVNGGILAVDGQNRLGTAPVVLGGGTLAVTTGATLSNRLVLTGSSTIFSDNSSSAVFTGDIEGRSTTAGLTFIGAGARIEGNATYTGPTIIGLGGNSPVRGATVTLRGTAGGTLKGSSSLTIGDNGSLFVDNSDRGSGASANRLSRIPVTLSGGQLNMSAGQAGSVSAEVLGSLTLVSNTGSSMELRPLSSIGAAARFEFTGPFTRQSGSTLVVTTRQADNLNIGILGQGGNGQGAVVFATPPPLTNGILANVFVTMQDDTLTSGLYTRLATTENAIGQEVGKAFLRELRRTDPGVILDTFTGASAASNVIFETFIDQIVTSRTVNSLSMLTGIIRVPSTATITLNSGQLAFNDIGATIARPLPTDPFGTLASPTGVDLSIGLNRNVNSGGVQLRNDLVVSLAPGSGTVNFVGSGKVRLFASNPLITQLNIQGATVEVIAPTDEVAFSPSTHVDVRLFSSLTFLDNQSAVIDTISGQGSISLGANTSLTVGANNGSSTFAGSLSGDPTSSLSKTGTGTLRFAEAFGPLPAIAVDVSGGTLAFGTTSTAVPPAAAAAGALVTLRNATTVILDGGPRCQRPFTVTGAATLDSTQTGSSTTFDATISLSSSSSLLSITAPSSGGFRFAAGFSGAGGLSLDSGNVILESSTHSGRNFINSSGLTGIASNTALGSGAITIAGGVNLLPVGGNRTLANAISLSGNINFGPSSNTDALSDGSNLTLTGGISLSGTGSRTISVTGTGAYSLQGISGSATTGLIKAGGGTLTLAGTNTYAGSTAVDAGTLQVTGTKSGTGAITIGTSVITNPLAVLSGTGTVSGLVSVQKLGIISPGASAGVLTLNSGVSFTASSTYLWELAANSISNPGTNYDQLVVGASPVLIQAGALLVPRFIGTASVPDGSTPFWLTGHSWVVIDSLSLASGTPFTIDNDLAWRSFGQFSAQFGSGGNVLLSWVPITAVPEPSSLLFLASIASMGVFVWWKRKSIETEQSCLSNDCNSSDSINGNCYGLPEGAINTVPEPTT